MSHPIAELNGDGSSQDSTRDLLDQHRRTVYRRTDQLFACLMVVQWIGAIGTALVVSPRAWEGTSSYLHPHVWIAVLLGGLISSLPVYLVITRPGTALTRHVIAVAQMTWSAMLIHLSGGRIETHFHVFGSLAFLAFYRDWPVIMTATIVVASDHLIRGAVWPQSVYGVLNASLWRSVEHASWVVFEDIFLVYSCLVGQREMREIAQRRADQENIHQKIEQEIRLRTQDLRTSRDELALASEQLEEHTAALEAKNDELRVERERAMGASRSKSEFLANMSHEIRTPMTAILGYADLLMDEGDLQRAPERRIEAIRTIQRNGEHLLSIINDILDLSKIEAGKMTVESVTCSPIQLLADVASLMRVRTDAKGISFGLEYDGPLPERIVTDPTRLRQILVNLVGNAIKFTEVGGVRLIARYFPGPQPRLEFDTVDTGVGMTEEQQRNIFQPFTQADSSTTRQFGGSGLGLAISKRLAEMLGGDVVVVHSVPQRGTRFRVTICPGPIEDVPLCLPGRNGEAISVNSTRHVPQAPSSILEGCRILLAEDGPDNQRLIAHLLKKAGAAVSVVDNGQRSLEVALAAADRGEPFHVILMDMQMPVLDGYSATALLRAKGYAGTIIALTAHAMSGDRDKCLAVGCNDYATKPIDRSKLVELLAAYSPRSVTA